MCCGCWQEDGAHQIDTLKVRQLALAMDAGDEYGPLHIVLGDDNLETDSIVWCRDDWGKEGGEQPYSGWPKADQVACELLLAATLEERVSANGLRLGCWGVVRP